MVVKERAIYISDAGLRALQTTMLSKTESSALWWIVSNLPVGGGKIKNQDLQLNLGIKHPPVASKVLKKLVETGFLRRMAKIETSYFYEINPNWIKLAR